jgi:very-short-patch-repair endonuclease
MEKKCELCGKDYKPIRKKQKYCSVECQHESYRKPKIEKVITICKFCNKEFYILPNKLITGKGKYCSRLCKDNHQKIIYSGTNNPVYGSIHTEKWKKNTSIRVKKLWESDEYRDKIKDSINKFIENNGYYPGTNDVSINNRRKTMIERYGVPHNWVGKYGERKCDKTTLNVYGKTATQMLIDYSHFYNKKTDIEKMFEIILEELEIPYQYKFRIYDKEKVNFWFREYDFLILNTNVLIEVDGDYWHGNENIFEELSDFQKSVQINDKIKENFANTKGYEIIRFWGSDVKKNNDKVKNRIKEIWEKLK